MRKWIMMMIGAVLLTVMFVGCSSKENTPAWTIMVEGVKDGAVSFTSSDFNNMEAVEIKAAMKNKDSSEPAQSWTGIPLKTVLESLGVKAYSSVIVESKDGQSKEYVPELVDSEGTILGVKVEGKSLDEKEGPVKLVVDGKGKNWWIPNVAKIIVKK
ncbi:molybdopterin-dependent oxidoreductase [Petroclostridium sp. X23]|uniref:molybdopterin-dependent oxidoreductase n=1 Tax=Petroclostridium sp. X23 TaxID=3045146 RepID=UPI0024AD3911|nr:molybdopterin-dependent oxidoreductase [Petroclostridium sp. X23]WHH58817.1 molybdopterin-dependent oxidoreductase [Petroclostridium sp. X23]